MPHICFIGFGEAAQAFSTGWQKNSTVTITAYDEKSDAKNTQAAKTADYLRAKIHGHATLPQALKNAGAVFSMVTPNQALSAAQNAARTIAPDTLYFDCNSCAPTTKRAAADVIHAAGAHYVDVAVMAPVHPKLHQTPVSISSPHHARALALMARLDMNATHEAGDIGTASSIKMIRSIMVKGLEALTLECYLSAKTAGVEKQVFTSLAASYPDFDWGKRVPYNMNRAMIHGNRRAEEMREVAKTVAALGLPNDMSNAITNWQHRVGDLNQTPQGNEATDLADQVLLELTKRKNS